LRRAPRAAAAGGVVKEAVVRESDGADRFAIARVAPMAVTTPATRAELAEHVADADARGAAIVPCGRGAHLGLGHAPARYDVALSTRALAAVVEYAPADMTVTVESGMTLAALDHLLGAEGQWLPLDPPLPAETTVGGLLAADLFGPLRATYGRARDYVLGIAMVTAAGVETRAGGRVVKNVAGYDLMKLLVGSLGTLGVITEATLKVRPRPETTDTLELACASRAAAIALVSSLPDVGPVAQSLVAIDAPGSEAAIRAVLGGVAADVAAARARVLDAARETTVVFDGDGDGDRDRVERRAEDTRDLPASAPADVVVRLSALRATAARLVTEADAALDGACTWLRFDPRAATATLGITTDDAAGALARVRAVAARYEAVVVVERWPAALAETIDVWWPIPAALPLMRRVKVALDPNRTFAPGRFVGRL